MSDDSIKSVNTVIHVNETEIRHHLNIKHPGGNVPANWHAV